MYATVQRRVGKEEGNPLKTPKGFPSTKSPCLVTGLAPHHPQLPTLDGGKGVTDRGATVRYKVTTGLNVWFGERTRRLHTWTGM